ncbi:MAG TPA: hypothetical protein VEB40_12610, partial [Flavipsychrobacter sp.]|nr:hypothetical protein [Flavipsychrobacter sp.]
QDTTIYINTKISDAEWKKVSSELFTMTVAGHDGTASVPFELEHTRNSIKVNNSAYATIPITLMAGAMANNTNVTYNWGLNTQFKLGDHFFSASYYSRQFGNNVDNNVQKGVLSASYGYKHWLLSVGRMSTVRNFFAVGNGFTLSYQNKTKEFSLTAIKHNKNISFFKNDNISAFAKYPIGKVVIEHFGEANFNKTIGLNGYILDNVATLINTEKLRVIGRGGLSLENNRNALDKNILLGYKVGYGFNYNLKRWSLSSNGDYHSPDFAGFRKGNSYHNHALNYKLSTTTFVGLTYSENIMKQNYFRDSVYHTDALSYNNKMMGVTFGHNAKVHSVNAGTGIFKFSNQGMYNLKQFYYANLSYGVRVTKRARLSIGTKAVFTGKGEIVRSISNLSFSNYHGGLMAMYVRSVNSSDAVDMSKISDLPVRETITGGPYVNFRLFRSTLTGSVRYNIAKALDEEQISSGVGADLNYTHPKLQTSIVLSGYAPFNHRNVNGLSYTETKYGTLSVMQPIGIPVIIKRKYYDFKIALYNDENGNGMRDGSEGPLDNVLVDINDQSMITDKNGEVTLKNTKIGQYNVGLYKAKREGLIPVNGTDVDFVVDENTNVNLAFKKGKVISGRVKVIQDMLKGEVSEQFIKIIATDSMGKKYTTLTDEEGNFFLYVANGTYDVSLNKDAFKYGDLKPVRVAFTADIDNNESAFVCFELRQKKREVRFLNQGLGRQGDKKPGDKVGKSEPTK